MKRNIYIGVAWPYVNGDLHIGHLAGYLIPFDICARYHRIIGNNVLATSGSDCFGTPITIEADKRGLKPTDIVNEYHTKDVDLLLNTLNLSYDLYTKTDNPKHKEVTQDIFLKFLEQDLIVIKTSEQYYSPTENRFLPDRYVKGECSYCNYKDSRSDQCDNCGKLLTPETLLNPRSNLSGEPVQLKETDHYYIDWPKLQTKLENYVNEKGPSWRNWVNKETLGWLKEGLQPRAITRDIDWGVEIPVDRIPTDKLISNANNKRFYVWFDAVIGYLSSSIIWGEENGKDWKEFWYNQDSKHYYFMGKDNLVFHTLFWPGQLMVYDPLIKLPDIPAVNQFLNFEGQQFSKSRNHTINSKEIVEKYGNDRVRFYLTLIMPENRDSGFSWEDFKEKVNGVLVANIGNFIHRSLSIAFENIPNFTQSTDSTKEFKLNKDLVNAVETTFTESRVFLENCEFRNYLDSVLKLSSIGNKYFDTNEVWVQKKSDVNAFNNSLFNLFYLIISLGILQIPLLPEGTKKLFDQIGIDFPELWPEATVQSEIEKLVLKVKLDNKPIPLFTKIDEVGL